MRLNHLDLVSQTPRELLLLRHAKSDWGVDGAKDFDRPLAKRGKADAPRVGAWLYREGLVPDHVVSSPAQRARQTATRICKAMELKARNVAWDERIYEADVARLLAVLADCPATARLVLLIGHNPGLEDLLRYLIGDELEEPDDGKLLPTAAVARIEMPKAWDGLERGCGQLIALTRPKALRD
ncbi:SixA phosphatase family protein [Thiococcus pfennigii]|uniref:SixA phosphatase family protein n=1 Tax=Thiococcus pfennigii TaxID=1057 RepID=UPI001902C466|nr:histidine phosphatase family protein [Thiococcus pfennigii]MBK1702265.1 phosphohistidine phosphatase [Thiococcus pfennigii]MBK1731317.1 phosphohistidine phosphatase [Thiococcus pfennigii]